MSKIATNARVRGIAFIARDYRKSLGMLPDRSITRRQALSAAACVFASAIVRAQTVPSTAPSEPIIDIHQHTTYRGRSNEALLHHQKKMGVSQTILLPGGSPVITESTLKGRANGLYAGAGTVDTCIPIAREHPHEYYFAANEVPDLPEAKQRIEHALKQGAVCIGEQKFNLPVDSPQMEMIYSIAQGYGVPVLMHFQYEMFNTGYERFGKVLEKWPKVTFIGHAVTFWANIDAGIKDQKVGYPKGKVTAGGLTDKYLSDYPNLWADMSAGSGLNAMIRDEDHARGFIERHYQRMMFGSDCPDPAGEGPTCTGASMIALIRRLSPSKRVERMLLHDNAQNLFKLS
jgi:predicted TIM-barrel fold metal-dependent hydrolase